MKISKEKLAAEAELTGFRAEVLEKVIHLLSLLDGFRSHPFSSGRRLMFGSIKVNNQKAQNFAFNAGYNLLQKFW